MGVSWLIIKREQLKFDTVLEYLHLLHNVLEENWHVASRRLAGAWPNSGNDKILQEESLLSADLIANEQHGPNTFVRSFIRLNSVDVECQSDEMIGLIVEERLVDVTVDDIFHWIPFASVCKMKVRASRENPSNLFFHWEVVKNRGGNAIDRYQWSMAVGTCSIIRWWASTKRTYCGCLGQERWNRLYLQLLLQEIPTLWHVWNLQNTQQRTDVFHAFSRQSMASFQYDQCTRDVNRLDSISTGFPSLLFNP